MKVRRILFVVIVLTGAVVLGWELNARPDSSIVVRYAEPPARGNGHLGLVSCGLRVEDATGNVIAQRRIPASAKGGQIHTVRIEIPRKEIASAQRVLATCTDAAGRTGEAATYALAPTQSPTRMASQRR